MDAPWTLKESKHKQLLHNILNALGSRAEAGGLTHIYKVKAHSGVKGNDIVDLGAKAAAHQVSRGLAGALIKETSDNAPYEGRTWACTKPNAALDDEDNTPAALPYVSSLLDGIKREIIPTLSGGQAAKQGIHATLWGMAVPLMHKPSNARMWKDPQIKWGQITCTMKARWGMLWNQKLAYQYKMYRWAASQFLVRGKCLNERKSDGGSPMSKIRCVAKNRTIDFRCVPSLQRCSQTRDSAE